MDASFVLIGDFWTPPFSFLDYSLGAPPYIHVVYGRFMIVLTFLMLATLLYSCFNADNAGKIQMLA